MMNEHQQGLEVDDNLIKSKSWGYMDTCSSQNNQIGLNQNVNLPLEDIVNSMSFEETVSSVLQFLAQDTQYMDYLKQLQSTKTLEKGFVQRSNASRHSDLVTHNQPVVPWKPRPEQPTSNHSEDEGKGEQQWREEEGDKEKLEEDLTKEEKRENEELCPKKTSVSKSLLDTLWAKFKLNQYPTVQERLSLSFEFNMTDKQIRQWFCKNRKKYRKEMSQQRLGKRLKR